MYLFHSTNSTQTCRSDAVAVYCLSYSKNMIHECQIVQLRIRDEPKCLCRLCVPAANYVTFGWRLGIINWWPVCWDPLCFHFHLVRGVPPISHASYYPSLPAPRLPRLKAASSLIFC